MKVLITGATGFTGSHVVPELLSAGHDVSCFVRPSSDRTRLAPLSVRFNQGTLDDENSLTKALQGKDALVNIASLGFGHAPQIVSAALAAGVSRAIFISTTAIFTNLNAPSKTVRTAAEELIGQSGLSFTILRPTMIYGSSRDRNMCRLIKLLQRYPAIPILGNGEYLQQPVYVCDVAKGVVQALGTDATVGKGYDIPGAEPITYNQVVEIICTALKRRVLRVHLPAGAITNLLTASERVRLRLPVKAEQVQRLNENKAFEYTEAKRDFGYSPLSFVDGIQLELKEMGIL